MLFFFEDFTDKSEVAVDKDLVCLLSLGSEDGVLVESEVLSFPFSGRSEVAEAVEATEAAKATEAAEAAKTTDAAAAAAAAAAEAAKAAKAVKRS